MKKLDSKVIEGFVNVFLLPRYDEPKPIPDFHRELWRLFSLPDKYVVCAAPRGHGKSTAITHAFVLASALFRTKDFIVICSDTESQAVQFLHDIKKELLENELIHQAFSFKELEKDTESEIVAIFEDGYRFKIVCKGAEQRLRGIKWRNKRPNLVIGDDLEDDEAVLNSDRREKRRKWIMNALLPAGSDSCVYRLVGTVLHFDSALERFLNDKNWKSKRFQAHNADFSKILWPEKFSKDRLLAIRESYQSQGNLEGYSQEYLNFPLDESTAYFRREDILPMLKDDFLCRKRFYAAVDLAISTADKANYTAITIAGTDYLDFLHVVEVRRGRWDSLEIIDQLFETFDKYEYEALVIEAGALEKAIGPFLNSEMVRRGKYISLYPLVPTKDKSSRARGIQARLRAKRVKVDKEADWFPDFEEELLRFPKAKTDDMVDSLAWIGLFLESAFTPNTPEEEEEEEYNKRKQESLQFGRNSRTGY